MEDAVADGGQMQGAAPSGLNSAPPRSVFGPTAAEERIDSLDILRGFALFGILWVNLPGGGGPAPADAVADRMQALLIQGKFMTIFAFVFGVGFSLQLTRAVQRGCSPVVHHLRRLALLFLIGLCHCVLIWDGDILTSYALFGAYLLAVRHLPQRAILALASVLLCVIALRGEITVTRRLAAQTGADQTWNIDPARVRERRARRAREQAHLYAATTYPRHLRQGRNQFKATFGSGWSYFPDRAFVLFLLGLWAGRRGVFQNPSAHEKFLRRVVWWGLPAGLIMCSGQMIQADLFDAGRLTWQDGAAFRLAGHIGQSVLGLSYAAAILVLVQSETWRRRLAPLRWAGRMALTNYLVQSLVFTTAAYGYGLGLHSKLTGSIRLLYVAVFFTSQLCLSGWWLARFRFGPAEWLWRSLTYARPQPWRARLPRTAAAYAVGCTP